MRLVGTGTPMGLAALRPAATAAAALLDLPLPARWTWTVEAGGAAPPHAELAVESLDDDLAAAALAAARTALAVTLPELVWERTLQPAGVEWPMRVDVVESATGEQGWTPAGPDLLPNLWQGIAGGGSRMRLRLDLRTSGTPTRRPLGCLSLAGTSPSVHVVAGVLAAGLSDRPDELSAVPGRPHVAPLPLTATRIGRCLAAVCLVEAWPDRSLTQLLPRALVAPARRAVDERIDRLLARNPDPPPDG